MRELNLNSAINNFVCDVLGARVNQIGLSIFMGQSQQGQTLTYGLLSFWVDVGRIADVHGNDHAGVFDFQSFELRLAKKRGRQLYITVVIGSDLHVVKRKITLPPLVTPAFDQSRKNPLVLSRVFDIGFTLIPNYATTGKRGDRANHVVVKCRRH